MVGGETSWWEDGEDDTRKGQPWPQGNTQN